MLRAQTGAQVETNAAGAPISIAGTPIGIGTAPTKTSRVIKQFTDLFGVTIATSNATVVSTIDTASPFGCPALKLVITFATTAGRVDVTPPAVNIPLFNGHVAYSMWIDDVTKIGEYSTFVGNAAYAKYQQAKTIGFNGGDLIAGHRVAVGGPIRKNNIVDGAFVFGTDTLQATKLRISAPNPIGGTATVWLKDCVIPVPQKPIISFTWDDGFDTWVTKVQPILSANGGIRATFGINTDQIDKGAFGITTANVLALISAGHHIASHNVFNYKLQTLMGTGLGEQNGSGTSSPVSSYVADYHTAKAALEALGADPAGFMFHPWVQGGMDHAGASAMFSSGCDLIRTTSPYEAQVYGVELGNNALAIRAVNLDSSRTLAQATAMIDDAIAYGGLVVFMGHQTGTPDLTTWAEADVSALVAYAASKRGTADILTMKEVRDRFVILGLLRQRSAQNITPPVRCIGRLIAANMNSTADQTITLDPGQWKIEGVYATKASTSLTTAAGGIYTTTAKGGTAIVAAAQVFSSLVVATDVLPETMAATPTVTGPVYLSLTTAQGTAATADLFVFGRPI